MKAKEISTEIIKKLEEELMTITDSYYLSVENRFNKTYKQDKREDLIYISGIVFIFLSFGAVLISLMAFFEIKFPSGGELSLGFTLVLLGTLLLYLPILVLGLLHLDGKRKKGLLRGEKLAFCYLYAAMKETNMYLINENDEHLDTAINFFSNYIENSEINFILEVEELRPAEMGGTRIVKKDTDLGSVIESISKQYWWFEPSKNAKKIINAYKDLIPKISLRIKHKIEIDKILPSITKLMFYEYLKIKRASSEPLELIKKYTFADLGLSFLFNFIDEINNLNYPDIRPEAKYSYLRIFKDKVLLRINSCLTSKNILVGFLSWYLLLLIIFIISIFIATKFVKIDIDSTIIIGLFAAPFAGAIIVSTAIYTKSK